MTSSSKVRSNRCVTRRAIASWSEDAEATMATRKYVSLS